MQEMLADSFGQQVGVAAIGAFITALLGGVAAGLIIQYAQNRREFVTVRTQLSLEMMRIGYSFYYPLIEVVRQKYYGQEVKGAELPKRFDEFRISARIVEAKLHAYFNNQEARYMWHGVVDALSLRYYGLMYGTDSPRTHGMMETHGKHSADVEIPPRARELFLSYEELSNDQRLMETFEVMLDKAIELVLNRKLDPSTGAGAILRPGRGSRLEPVRLRCSAPPHPEPSKLVAHGGRQGTAGVSKLTRIGDNPGVLLSLLDDLAEHFRTYGEHGLANAVAGAADGEPEQFPRRVLALFRRGMGGLLDCPLYSHGKVDRAATDRRDELADQVYEAARAMMH